MQAAKNAWDIFSIKLFNLTEINLRSILQEKLFFLNGLFSPSPLSLGQNKVYDITCEPSLWFRPIHLSKCSEIPVRWFFLCSHLDWALLKMKRVPQSQSPKMSNAARGKEFVCGRWLTGLFRLPESCHVQQCTWDTCSSSLHTSLASAQLWWRFKWQISDRHAAGGVLSCLYVDVMRFLWEGSYVWVGVFGEHLAGNADSSQQNENRRVSVIVSLRENMNVCQKHCKKWWRFPVVLQMVFPSSLPITLIAFSLAGLQLPVCFTIGLQCTRLPVPPSRYPLFYREHTLCGCERQLS